MPLISQADAMAILEPHMDALYAIATSPWDEYHARVPADLLVDFCRRTRASAIHNIMVRDSTKYAATGVGVRVFERQLMKGIIVDGRIALRLKKLDEDGYSRGRYTKQVEEYRSQQVLDGIDASAHLELGYVLNGNETNIAQVRIVCPSGRGLAWSSRIDRSGAQPIVSSLFPNDNPSSGSGGAVIKPKDNNKVVPIRRNSDEG